MRSVYRLRFCEACFYSTSTCANPNKQIDEMAQQYLLFGSPPSTIDLAPSCKIYIINAASCTNTITQMRINTNKDARNTAAILVEKPHPPDAIFFSFKACLSSFTSCVKFSYCLTTIFENEHELLI